MKLGNMQVSLPQAIVLAAGLLALAAVLTWAPEDTRAVVIEWLGWGVAAASALLGPLLRAQTPAEEGAQRRARRRATALDDTRRGGPPSTGAAALALAVLAAACTLTAQGCGATLDPVYAGIGQGALEVAVEAEPVIRAARSAAMRSAAERVHGAGGTREEAHAAVGAEANAWQCAVDGHRIFGAATSAYVDALLLASGGGELTLDVVLRFAGPLLDAWRALASCVGARGGTLPVPAFLDLIPPTWGLSTEVSDAG